MLLGIAEALRQRGAAAIGWFLIAISTIIFTIVDAFAGFVLPPLAAANETGFLAAKTAFNVLFLAGTATFGFGARLSLAGAIVQDAAWASRSLAIPALLAGVVAAVTGIAGLARQPRQSATYRREHCGLALFYALIGMRFAFGRHI